MSDQNFGPCLQVVLANEGGFVNDPQDPGGATNLGVTLDTWSAWIGRGATIPEIEVLNYADVSPLYHARYWVPTGCNDWPAGVDLVVFDTAVNQGPTRAVRWLQTAAGAAADGVIGSATQAAVGAASASALIDSLTIQREGHYRSLPTFGRFGNGWMARAERTKAAALKMATP